MDTKEFLKKIKQYIKIEVENQLNESVGELISENNKLKKEIVLIKKKLTQLPLIEQRRQDVPNNVKKFTPNKEMNNILNETYRTMAFDSSDVNNYQTEMQEAYSDISMDTNVDDDIALQSSNIPDFNKMIDKKLPKPTVSEMMPDDMKHLENRIPNFLKNAFTKDYSEEINKYKK